MAGSHCVKDEPSLSRLESWRYRPNAGSQVPQAWYLSILFTLEQSVSPIPPVSETYLVARKGRALQPPLQWRLLPSPRARYCVGEVHGIDEPSLRGG